MKTKITALILFVIIQNSFLCRAQWQALNGPFGIETTASVFSDSLCLGATMKGLISSSDTGQNWTLVNTGISGTRSLLEADEGIIIFDRSYNTSGGLVSFDSGSTWQSLTTLGQFAPVKYQIENGIFYAWCSYGFLFYSTDSGSVWNAMTTAPTTNNITDLTVDNGRMYVSKSSFGTAPPNIYFTDDFGTTWDSLPKNGMNATNEQSFQVLANDSQIFITQQDAIYKSIDGGNNWTLFNNGLPADHFRRISIAGGLIYASLDNRGGLYRSDTTVASFIDVSNGMPLENKVYKIEERNGMLYASTASGIFRSDKVTINWQPYERGINFTNSNSIRAIGSTVYLGTYYNYNVSYDNGENFTAIPLAERTMNFYIDGNTVYACGAYGLKSSDGGHVWENLNYPYGNFNQNLSDFCRNGNNWFGLNLDGLLKTSTDSGSTWTILNVTPATTVNCLTSTSGNLFAGTMNGIYKSINNGSSWSVYLPAEVIVKMVVENNIIYALTNSTVYYSINNGISWVNSNYPGPFTTAFTVHNNTIVVSPGLYFTTTFGSNWDSIPEPSSTSSYAPGALCLTDSFLFAGYGDTLFRNASSIITGIHENTSEHSRLILSPNPVANKLLVTLNPVFIKDEFIRIDIADLSGRNIYSKSLSPLNGTALETNCEGLEKGLYIISIHSASGNISAKFLKE